MTLSEEGGGGEMSRHDHIQLLHTAAGDGGAMAVQGLRSTTLIQRYLELSWWMDWAPT